MTEFYNALFLLRTLLPLSSFFIFVIIFFREGLCLRSSVLASSVLWGVVVTLLTELLSLGNLLNGLWLTVAWSSVLLIAILIAHSLPQKNVAIKYHLSRFHLALIASLSIIIIITFIIAIVAAPNNSDSMVYHLSRVAHWVQDQSVAHYPTNILSQVELNPWAEFAITHFQILSQSDYFANLIQWFAMVGSMVGVTLIAGQFSDSVSAQIFAAVFAGTIPMGILQATSTQNDYVVAFWLVCFVYFGIKMKSHTSLAYIFAVGASLGLAILTKATAYIYAFPFFIYFAVMLMKSGKRGRFYHFMMIGAVVVLINFGHYYRNYQTFGNIFDSGGFRYTNEAHGLKTLLSNLSRNVALHMGTPSETVNNWIESLFVKLHALMNANANDPQTTFLHTKFHVNMLTNNEDSAGNPVHFVLICITIVIAMSQRWIRKIPDLFPFMVALLSAFILFCFVLKWQPWHSRLHLSLFILWAPIVAVVLSGLKWKRLADDIMVGLLLAAIPWVLFNGTRPFIGFWGHESIFQSDRVDQYFIDKPSLEKSYNDVAASVKMNGCGNIGLRSDGGYFEYPLWVLLHKFCNRMPRLEYISVTNATARIPLHDFNYSSIITLQADGILLTEHGNTCPHRVGTTQFPPPLKEIR